MEPQKTLNSQRNPKRGEKTKKEALLLILRQAVVTDINQMLKKFNFALRQNMDDFVPLKQFW